MKNKKLYTDEAISMVKVIRLKIQVNMSMGNLKINFPTKNN